MLYLVLKAAHIIGVVLFLGNIVTGVFWKAHADRSGDPRTIANTLEGIIRSDRFFTIPGVIVVLAAGVATALAGSTSPPTMPSPASGSSGSRGGVQR